LGDARNAIPRNTLNFFGETRCAVSCLSRCRTLPACRAPRDGPHALEHSGHKFRCADERSRYPLNPSTLPVNSSAVNIFLNAEEPIHTVSLELGGCLSEMRWLRTGRIPALCALPPVLLDSYFKDRGGTTWVGLPTSFFPGAAPRRSAARLARGAPLQKPLFPLQQLPQRRPRRIALDLPLQLG